MLELRQKLLHQHLKYMRLMTNEEIKELTREKILQLMSTAHYHASPNATTHELQQQLAVLQRSRTLAVWHDHSTVLRQGYILLLDQLLVANLREELTARGYEIHKMLKPEMQALLTAELKGAQRVPSLLVLNPTQSLRDLHLQDYEVLDCEPLHDYKGHAYNFKSFQSYFHLH